MPSGKSYNFYGNMNIPIRSFRTGILNLNILEVLFRDGTTFLRVAHPKQTVLEAIFLKFNVTFVPEVKNEFTKFIRIKQIRLNEKIKTVVVEGKKTTTYISTYNRYFSPNGFKSGIVEYGTNGTEFSQTYEDSGFSQSTTGASSAVQGSLALIMLSVLLSLV